MGVKAQSDLIDAMQISKSASLVLGQDLQKRESLKS